MAFLLDANSYFRIPLEDGLELGLISFYASVSVAKSSQSFSPANYIMARAERVQELLRSQPYYLAPLVGCPLLLTPGQIIMASVLPSRTTLDALVRRDGPVRSVPQLKSWVMQLLFALDHLHSHGMVVGNLSLENIYVDPRDRSLCIFNYALYFITGQGVDVDFPIGSSVYKAPEYIGHDPEDESDPAPFSAKCDTWALGVVLLELVSSPFPSTSLAADTVDQLLSRAASLGSEIPETVDPDLRDLISKCLTVDPLLRPSIGTLLSHSFLGGCERPLTWFKRPYIPVVNPTYQSLAEFSTTIPELFYLWGVNGGD
ncbi:hypothetical protein HDU91_000385, partial [Kappamyces sp. JEL0680]